MSKYKIKPLQYEKAKELGVAIFPSKNKKKKIDVFVDDKRILAIGAAGMNDYATYLKKDPSIAEKRRENYVKRHSKEPKIDEDGEFTKSFFADEILWGKKRKNVNAEARRAKTIIGKIKKEIKQKEDKKKKKEKKEKPKKKS
tara:strand:+ start:272 stop:697 length:426 start_codon:yes stop_codon:yes gene_type:complete